MATTLTKIHFSPKAVHRAVSMAIIGMPGPLDFIYTDTWEKLVAQHSLPVALEIARALAVDIEMLADVISGDMSDAGFRLTDARCPNSEHYVGDTARRFMQSAIDAEMEFDGWIRVGDWKMSRLIEDNVLEARTMYA